MATAIEPRPVGRPSDYRDEYADLLIAHFEMPAWETAINGKMVEGFFPTLSSFCNQIKTTRQTLWSWVNAKDQNGSPLHPEFLDAVNRAKEYQEQYFVQGYLAGKYVNPAIGALMAKNLLDWRDKSEVDQTLNAKVEAKVEIVDLNFEEVRRRMEAAK